MNLIALMTTVILLEYFGFVILVGRARIKSGIKAPLMSGSVELERAVRVQQNTIEQLIITLPALWLFGMYVSPQIGAALGLVFAVGRALYCKGYLADPEKRAVGFLVGMISSVILLIGSMVGIIISLLN